MASEKQERVLTSRFDQTPKLSGFLARNGLPFRVFDPDEHADASALVARYAPAATSVPVPSSAWVRRVERVRPWSPSCTPSSPGAVPARECGGKPAPFELAAHSAEPRPETV